MPSVGPGAFCKYRSSLTSVHAYVRSNCTQATTTGLDKVRDVTNLNDGYTFFELTSIDISYKVPSMFHVLAPGKDSHKEASRRGSFIHNRACQCVKTLFAVMFRGSLV